MIEQNLLPLVSVIVPVYNVEKYLKQCLDSLINQTLRNIEIICVNDASPDNSLTILREYEAKDCRVKIVDLKENLCIGGARNVGIKIAHAQYIAFLDSDDWVAVDMYEKLYLKAISTNADIVNCDYFEYYSDNDIRTIVKYPKSVFDQVKEESNKHFILQMPAAWHNLYKIGLFKSNLLFPEHTFYEDAAIMSTIFLLANRIVKVNIPLYYYRMNNIASICRRKGDYRFFERINGMNILIQHMQEYGFYEKYNEELEYQYMHIAYHDTVMGSIFLFPQLEKNEIVKAKNNMKNKFPNYLKNRYYKQEPLNIRKIIFKILDFDTKLGLLCAHFIHLYIKRRRQ
ncbi:MULTISPECIES: glycosyltransferase family 2 protein [Bacteroides]|jgi:glycosyltransferase involved in cell wall biosynthesis|uniref:glycosyltransferase family 2 protein n=1 Tax=Bacteroides TaxID=816 RepID=UPI000ACBB399|nr:MULTISPECIES: glycosyltransferase family 2 protein [Bacteroides]